MSISAVDSSVNYTLNGNQYQSSNTGKKVGTAVGAGLAAASSVLAYKSGRLVPAVENAITRYTSHNTGKFANLLTKNAKFAKFGILGLGMSAVSLLYAGVGRLIGHAVDRNIENKRAKEADALAAETANVEYLA